MVRKLLQPLLRQLADLRMAPDSLLLKQFVADRDSSSLEELIRRYSGLVWQVCHCTTNSRQDTEDAFQATFLSLVEKAHSIHNPQALGGWLQSVAFRIATRARRKSQRSQGAAQVELTYSKGSLEQSINTREAQRLLHEEMARLPEELRVPLLLCYFEEMTRDQAADILGLSFATLKRRLEQGRAILRARLTRRGLTASAITLTTILSVPVQSAPPAITQAICAVAVPKPNGSPAVSPSVTWLMKGSGTMYAKSLLIGAFVLLLSLTASLTLQAQRVIPSAPKLAEKPENEKKATDLDGSWQVLRLVHNGKEEKDDIVAQLRLEIQGGKLKLVRQPVGKALKDVGFTLDLGKSPAQIKIQVRNGPLPGVGASTGIYEIKGNRLKLCLDNVGGRKTPEKFESKKGQDRVLIEAKRIPRK